MGPEDSEYRSTEEVSKEKVIIVFEKPDKITSKWIPRGQ